MVLQKIAKISCQSQFNKSSECLYCTLLHSIGNPSAVHCVFYIIFFISRAIKKIFLNKPSTLSPLPYLEVFQNSTTIFAIIFNWRSSLLVSSVGFVHLQNMLNISFMPSQHSFILFKKHPSYVSPLPYLEVFQNSKTIFAIIFNWRSSLLVSSEGFVFLPIKHPFILSHPFTFYLKAEYVFISKQFSKLDN